MLTSKKLKLAAALLVLTGLVWAVAHVLRRSNDEIPPASANDTSAYRNARPGVAYVGDQRCAECHFAIAERYRKHPMGRSLERVTEAVAIESYADGTRVSFATQGFEYEVLRQGDKAVHRESRRDSTGRLICRREAEIQYVLGSGERGRNYLFSLEGRLFQSPISWYSQARKWDLGPGYHQNNTHFERAVSGDCLFCHSNRVEPVADTLNQFKPPLFRGHAIGCERCHGPGEIHVREQATEHANAEHVTEAASAIVNPRKLPSALRDSVCEQCHLQGVLRVPRHGHEIWDYRPGLPLSDFLAVFVKPPEAPAQQQAVSHVEQMTASACYRKSAGRLGCISCHDPHGVPLAAEKAAYYRGRCLECHGSEGRGCAQPLERRKARENDCAACHMPRVASADVAHTAVTDHRVPRQAAGAPAGSAPASPHPAALRQVPLVHFHENQLRPDESIVRELALALTRVGVVERQPQAFQLAGPRLEESLRSRPHDIPVLGAKAISLAHLGRPAEALAAFETVLALAPRHEEALAWAAAMAQALALPDKAVKYGRLLVEVNPAYSNYHVSLGKSLFERKSWAEAAREATEALRLNPARLDARRLLLLCHHQLGERDKVKAEWPLYEAFRPPDLEEVRKLLGSRK